MKKISNLPRVLGPADSAVCERHDCTTLQLCDDSQVISKWVNGDFTVGGQHQRRLVRFKRFCTVGGGENWRDP